MTSKRHHVVIKEKVMEEITIYRNNHPEINSLSDFIEKAVVSFLSSEQLDFNQEILKKVFDVKKLLDKIAKISDEQRELFTEESLTEYERFIEMKRRVVDVK